jgi:intergrase/recombinase
MAALAALSKYRGCYDRWLDIRRRYNLKWSSPDTTMASFEEFFSPSSSLESMMQKVTRMIAVLPPHMGEVVRFAALTALRPTEAVDSVRLSKDRSDARCPMYYNHEREVLEHYRLPEIFLRQTKKAYISYLSRDNYHAIASLSSKTPSYNAIRQAVRKKGLNMEMRLARKIFASHLSACGIQSEVIDFLQGRVSPSVFGRHYLRPQADLKDRVLQAVAELDSKLA